MTRLDTPNPGSGAAVIRDEHGKIVGVAISREAAVRLAFALSGNEPPADRVPER